MKEHEEKEYKVMLSEKQFQRLCDLLGNPRPVKQENRYYDTEDWKIRRQYGSMRIRTINNKHIFTLKIRKTAIRSWNMNCRSVRIRFLHCIIRRCRRC